MLLRYEEVHASARLHGLDSVNLRGVLLPPLMVGVETSLDPPASKHQLLWVGSRERSLRSAVPPRQHLFQPGGPDLVARDAATSPDRLASEALVRRSHRDRMGARRIFSWYSWSRVASRCVTALQAGSVDCYTGSSRAGVRVFFWAASAARGCEKTLRLSHHAPPSDKPCIHHLEL